jgi:hypothetical protein
VNRHRDAVNEGSGAEKGEEGAIAVTGKDCFAEERRRGVKAGELNTSLTSLD